MACGSRPASPRTTTSRPSPASSTRWPSVTCRCRYSTLTASGCGSSTGATSSGIRAPSRSRRQPCSRVCMRRTGTSASGSTPTSGSARRSSPRPRRPATSSRNAAVMSGSLPSGRQAWAWSTSPIRMRPGGNRPSCADGSSTERMHNYYPQLYNQAVFDVLKEARGEGEAVLFARSATVGGQQLPAHWGGDSASTYESMAETPSGGLSLAFSGFAFWSHDIGGFEGTPDPGVFKRWTAFGLLSSHSRLHGSSSYRVPWAFDDEAVEVTRKFKKLKLRLMPYLFAAGLEATRIGTPVLRPMQLEFGDDPATGYLDRQYMLGADVLVAPCSAPTRVSSSTCPLAPGPTTSRAKRGPGPAGAGRRTVSTASRSTFATALC